MEDNNSSNAQSKSVLKREAIIQAASRVFSQKGYMESSIKNITDEASVAVGSFYSYFKNKEEVLEAIYEEIFDMSLQMTSNIHLDAKDSVVKRFTLAMASAVWTYAGNKELSKLLLIKSMGINELFEKKRWEILDKTNSYLKGILRHLNKEHSIEINDIEISSVLLTHSIFGVITYWLEERFNCNLNELVFSICIYHLRALNIDFNVEEVKQYIGEVLDAQ